jgi:hypothetical protein
MVSDLPDDRNIQSVTNRRSASNAPAIAALIDPGVRSRLIDLRLEVFPREQLEWVRALPE